MSDCPHGFSSASWCAECSPTASVATAEPEHAHAIRAQYEGRCVECRDPIEKDEWIVPAHQGGWAHDECL